MSFVGAACDAHDVCFGAAVWFLDVDFQDRCEIQQLPIFEQLQKQSLTLFGSGL